LPTSGVVIFNIQLYGRIELTNTEFAFLPSQVYPTA